MDYFQGVVAEYVRANRACFINPEFLLALDPDAGEHKKDRHWYVDLLAVNLIQQCAYLCEVTYARKPAALIKRLGMWRSHWDEIRAAVQRDAGLPAAWSLRPWVFVPGQYETQIKPCLESLFPSAHRFTRLEDILPWNFVTWDRVDDKPPLSASDASATSE